MICTENNVMIVLNVFLYSITAYVQQIGKTGRSGMQAEGILYFNNSDLGQPSVKKSMKKYGKNVPVCRRKELNSYFGCEFNSNIRNCCDICQPALREQWKLCAVPSSEQKMDIRDKINKHLTETEFMLDPFVFERILYDVHLYQNSQSIISEFGLCEELATLSDILVSCLQTKTS